MEEKVKMMDGTVVHTDIILTELSLIITDFVRVCSMSTDERNEFFHVGRIGLKKRMRISFGSEEEIERMRKGKKFKLNVRNALGIRH